MNAKPEKPEEPAPYSLRVEAVASIGAMMQTIVNTLTECDDALREVEGAAVAIEHVARTPSRFGTADTLNRIAGLARDARSVTHDKAHDLDDLIAVIREAVPGLIDMRKEGDE